jgi:hypothetical protein
MAPIKYPFSEVNERLLILFRNPTPSPRSLGTRRISETHAVAHLLQRRERDHALRWRELQTQG